MGIGLLSFGHPAPASAYGHVVMTLWQSKEEVSHEYERCGGMKSITGWTLK